MTTALVDDAVLAEVLERTLEIAAVPAPTGSEGARADVVRRWWLDDGLGPVSLDAVGNCWARARAGVGPAIVLAAHLDTVFAHETEHGLRRDGERLVGPGAGDNCVALAALGAVGRLVASLPGSSPVLLVATVGEEGLGDLAGARHAVADPPHEIGAFIAVEGNYLGRIGTIGVGCRRLRVEVRGRGGHAWEESFAPSALHAAAGIVDSLGRLATVPGTTSLNVGRFAGGEAVNARARAASFELDLRGADEAALGRLEQAAQAILQRSLERGLSLEVTEIGRRPSGRIEEHHPLLLAAREAHERCSIAWREIASSTDANAAHAAGIPALALGVTVGAGEHTPEEWIETAPIAAGLAMLAGTVAGLERAAAPSTRQRSEP